jgi:organic radical activating enzyme
MPGQFNPITAYLFLDYKCNLDCWYCWAFNNKVKGMTEDVAKRSIDWLHDHGCRVLALMGGEPLLRPDFAHKVVNYAAKKGFWIYIGTNGRLLRPEVADRRLVPMSAHNAPDKPRTNGRDAQVSETHSKGKPRRAPQAPEVNAIQARRRPRKPRDSRAAVAVHAPESRPDADTAPGSHGTTGRIPRGDSDPWTVPQSVRDRFVQDGHRFYFPDGAAAFKDLGRKLTTPSENTQVVHGLIEIAHSRGLPIRLMPLSPHGPEGLDFYDDAVEVAGYLDGEALAAAALPTTQTLAPKSPQALSSEQDVAQLLALRHV